LVSGVTGTRRWSAHSFLDGNAGSFFFFSCPFARFVRAGAFSIGRARTTFFFALRRNCLFLFPPYRSGLPPSRPSFFDALPHGRPFPLAVPREIPFWRPGTLPLGRGAFFSEEKLYIDGYAPARATSLEKFLFFFRRRARLDSSTRPPSFPLPLSLVGGEGARFFFSWQSPPDKTPPRSLSFARPFFEEHSGSSAWRRRTPRFFAAVADHLPGNCFLLSCRELSFFSGCCPGRFL